MDSYLFKTVVTLMYLVSAARCNSNDINLSLMDVMNELRTVKNIVKQQNERILYQDRAIVDLKNRISHLESCCCVLRTSNTADSDHGHSDTEVGAKVGKRPLSPQQNIGQLSKRNGTVRKERIFLPTPSSTPTHSSLGLVAFYAYMSKSEPNPGNHHILTYDHVVTNIGNGYHPYSGIFVTPRSGVYIFTWTVRQHSNSYSSTELLVNNAVVGNTYVRCDDNDDISSTSTAIVHVSINSNVLVRTHPTTSIVGYILSDNDGRTSFAGWTID